MAGDWPETTWGSIAELKYGKAMSAYTDQPNVARVYGTNGPIGWHDTALQPGPGVIVGRKGAYRGIHYANQPFWVIDTAYYLSPLVPMDLRWAYYWLRNYDVNNIDDGSPIPSTTREAFGFTAVKLPPLPEQTKIANLLASLDAKIDLDRQMSATLEEMARALFTSWFVNFDPVHAKAEGRDTGLPAEIEVMFPDSFGDKDLPKGWHLRSLYDFSRVIYGAPFSSSRFNSHGLGLPLIRVRDLASHKPTIFTDEEHRVGRIVQPGDIIVGMDGEFRCHVWKGKPSYLNQRVCHFEPRGATPISFVALAIESPLAQFERAAVGTTVIHLGKRDLDTVDLIWPGDALMKAFGYAADPLFTRSVAAYQEFRQLEQLRDTLLPKLLSGELRVNDAADLIAAA